MHQIVKSMYSWRQVAERTERAYNFMMQQPVMNSMNRVKSAVSWGQLAGLYAVLYQVIEFLVLWFIEWFYPEGEIDIVRNFNTEMYAVNPHKFGDHELRVDSSQNYLAARAAS